jgi:hypothetical protein
VQGDRHRARWSMDLDAFVMTASWQHVPDREGRRREPGSASAAGRPSLHHPGRARASRRRLLALVSKHLGQRVSLSHFGTSRFMQIHFDL